MAFIAIVISIRALSHQQRHDKLRLRPQLTFRFESNASSIDRHTVRWIVQNNGLGPAVLRNFVVVANEHSTVFPSAGYTRGLFAQSFKGRIHEEVFKKEEIIPAGNSIVLLSVEIQYGVNVPQVLNTIHWNFKYASFFDEEWDLLTDRIPLPLKFEWEN